MPIQTNTEFSSSHSYPTLAEPGINWEERLDGTQTQFLSLEAAFANLLEIRNHLVQRTPYPGALSEYVDVVNLLDAPRWVKLCAATGIPVLRDMVNGAGFNPGALTEFSTALSALENAYVSERDLRA